MHMVRKPSELIVPPGMRRVRVGWFATRCRKWFVRGAANMNAFGLTLKQSGNSKPWSLFMATPINRSIYPSKTDIAAAASGPHTCITCTHWSRGKD